MRCLAYGGCSPGRQTDWMQRYHHVNLIDIELNHLPSISFFTSWFQYFLDLGHLLPLQALPPFLLLISSHLQPSPLSSPPKLSSHRLKQCCYASIILSFHSTPHCPLTIPTYLPKTPHQPRPITLNPSPPTHDSTSHQLPNPSALREPRLNTRLKFTPPLVRRWVFIRDIHECAFFSNVCILACVEVTESQGGGSRTHHCSERFQIPDIQFRT